MSTTMAGVFSV